MAATNGLSAGIGQEVTLALTNAAVLNWLWTTNYWFQRAAGANGTVGGSTNGWYADGSQVTVTASGDRTFRFASWTGDVPEDHAGDNPLTLTLAGARSVAAQFAFITLADALNNARLTWTTGGNSVWWGQSATNRDGISAAQSGVIGDRQTSRLQTTVYGAGALSFWWKVSSLADYDFLRFKVDGTTWREISGETGWQQVTLRIEGSGAYTLEWSYTKDTDTRDGADAAWVDQVLWSPDVQATSHGTPFAWLDVYGLGVSGDYEAADLADADHDGMQAWQEHVAGTVPTNALSVFRATIEQAGGQMSVHWTPDLTNAVPARVYSVYGTSNLLGGFPVTPVTNLPAGASVIGPSLAPYRFFKIGVNMQP